MNMKVRMKIGLESQAYAAPRAESIAMNNEGLLCASVDGGLQSFEQETVVGTWDDPVNP